MMVPKFTRIANASATEIMAEICEFDCRDGSWEPTVGLSTGLKWFEMLAIRHDRGRAFPREHWGPYYEPEESNPDGRGNVAFVDGHVDYVSRRFAQDPHNWLPHFFLPTQ